MRLHVLIMKKFKIDFYIKFDFVVKETKTTMIDYMSEYLGETPAPSLVDAKLYIIKTCQNIRYMKNYVKIFIENKNTITHEHNIPTEVWDRDFLDKAFLQSNVLVDKKIKFSYRGWAVFGVPDVHNKLNFLHNEYFEKIITRRNYLKRLFKTSVRLSIILRILQQETVERLYHPDSLFIKGLTEKNNKLYKNLDKDFNKITI